MYRDPTGSGKSQFQHDVKFSCDAVIDLEAEFWPLSQRHRVVLDG